MKELDIIWNGDVVNSLATDRRLRLNSRANSACPTVGPVPIWCLAHWTSCTGSPNAARTAPAWYPTAPSAIAGRGLYTPFPSCRRNPLGSSARSLELFKCKIKIPYRYVRSFAWICTSLCYDSPLPSGSCSSMMALSCLAFNFLLSSTMTQCISVMRLSCAAPIASNRRWARSFSSNASFSFFCTVSRSRSECCKRVDSSNTSVLRAERAATWSCEEKMNQKIHKLHNHRINALIVCEITISDCDLGSVRTIE